MTVTLTAYSWASPSVYNTDRVSFYNNLPNGVNDFIGSFTLNVQAVPEPSSFLLIVLATPLIAACAWRGHSWKRTRR